MRDISWIMHHSWLSRNIWFVIHWKNLIWVYQNKCSLSFSFLIVFFLYLPEAVDRSPPMPEDDRWPRSGDSVEAADPVEELLRFICLLLKNRKKSFQYSRPFMQKTTTALWAAVSMLYRVSHRLVPTFDFNFWIFWWCYHKKFNLLF